MAGGSKLKNAISWLGLVDDDRFEEPPLQAEEKPAAVGASPSPEPAPVIEPDHRSDKGGFAGDNSATVLLTTGIVMTPTTYKEIQPIADRYSAGLPTIMDLKVMSIADAKSSVDFFSGMLYALHGSIRRVAKGVFLLEPVGVTLDAAALDQALADVR